MQVRSHILVGALAAGASIAAFGHHSVEASFDTENPIALEGVVETTIWVNPHAYLLLSVKGADGATEGWAVELSAPNALVRRGIGRETFAPGDRVSVTAYRQLPGVIAVTKLSVYDNRELEDLLNEVYDRAAADRLVSGSSITLPDGTTLVANGGRWMQDPVPSR